MRIHRICNNYWVSPVRNTYASENDSYQDLLATLSRDLSGKPYELFLRGP